MEKTIMEQKMQSIRELVFESILPYFENKKDIRVVKCIEASVCGELKTTGEEEADSFRIIKAPKSGYIKIKATFNKPRSNANTFIIYYKDKIFAKKKIDFITSGSDHNLVIAYDVGYGE